MSMLFTAFEIGKVELQNRIVIPPMCQYSARHGEASDWHLIHFGNMVLSGAGLFIIEATAVDPRGRITPYDLGLWSDETHAALSRALQPARKYSKMPIAIQLAHAGRKASTARPWEGGLWIPPSEGGWLPLAPSALPYHEADPAPHVLSTTEIDEIIEAFITASLRAVDLGIDIIELHAAHGYLLHEFLSPLSNHRTDVYGGTPENRMRLTLEIFRAMRDAVTNAIPVGVRISATDWIDGGWTPAESVMLANRLKALGADYIHVSSGGLSPLQKIPLSPCYQAPLAETIRQQSGLPTIAVGLIQTAEEAEKVLVKQQADLVGVARAMIFDPRWPWHAASKLGAQMKVPAPCWRCVPSELSANFSPELDPFTRGQTKG